VSYSEAQFEMIIAAGASRIIARAADSREIDIDILGKRVCATVVKYLLGDNPNSSENEISDFIDALYADDLCLIVACELGNEAAWVDLVNQFGATVKSAARSASSNEDMAEDLAQSIWAELYGLRSREVGRSSGKLGYYSGRGSLGGWLRAVVGQLAIDQHRKQSRLIQIEEDRDFDVLAQDSSVAERHANAIASANNPEDELSTMRSVRDVDSAFASAIAELAPEDRLLVKLYYFDGLRLREAGAVMGFHEATASRRLARVHSGIRKRVEEILIDERGWTRAETTRSLSEAAMQLGSDIESLVSAGLSAHGERAGP
jgi:RNA polymerase sigma-70 factor (ECF subfamily)